MKNTKARNPASPTQIQQASDDFSSLGISGQCHPLLSWECNERDQSDFLELWAEVDAGAELLFLVHRRDLIDLAKDILAAAEPCHLQEIQSSLRRIEERLKD